MTRTKPGNCARALRRGFTLIEVLVVLLIVSVIMVGMTQLLEAARISRDTIHNIQETQLAGPAILDLVERDIRGLDVYDRDTKSLLRVTQRVVLGHDADSLDFVTTTDGMIPNEVDHRIVRADTNEVGYRVRVNPQNDDFLELYRREDFGVDDEPFDGGAFTFLHDHVKHFDVLVFDEDGPDAEPIEDWGRDDDKQGLPLRIEVRLTLELAPRVTGEQLSRLAPADKRTLTYTRIIRLPQSLRDELEIVPSPTIPNITPPTKGPVGGAAPGTGGGGASMGLDVRGGKGGGGKPRGGKSEEFSTVQKDGGGGAPQH
jgi:prepilin-type N-terminal cleavage/methylation domain-containing protein